MNLLESAMAFAVVMIIFSTLVTGIVEAILRSLGTREKNLRKTIEALFDKVVWPRLYKGLESISAEKAAAADSATDNAIKLKSMHKERFVKDLTENPISEPGGKYNPERKSRIDALSLLSFAERLGKSDVGKAIAAENHSQVDLLVKDLARGFERFGRAASEVFRKKAQLTAICVAIPFAWAVNIDAARLLDQLINNPEIRTSLIEQADEAKKENDAAESSLAALQAKIAAVQAAQDSGSTPPSDSSEPIDTGTLQQQLSVISEQIEETKNKLEAEGLEIGWRYYPLCGEGNADKACKGRVWLKDKDGQDLSVWSIIKSVEFATWFLMSTLAGVLIGLGGPFWFRVFSSLSQVFQALKVLAPGGRKPAKDAPPAAQTITEDPAKSTDVLDAFKVAVTVNQQVSIIALEPPATSLEAARGNAFAREQVFSMLDNANLKNLK